MVPAKSNIFLSQIPILQILRMKGIGQWDNAEIGTRDVPPERSASRYEIVASRWCIKVHTVLSGDWADNSVG
jgi:hypothetical protein